MTIKMPRYYLEAHEQGSAPCFWTGGVQWEWDVSTAVLFADEELAFATLKALAKTRMLHGKKRRACGEPAMTCGRRETIATIDAAERSAVNTRNQASRGNLKGRHVSIYHVTP